jgi:hypothetical protein
MMDTTLAEALPVEPAPEVSPPDEPHAPETVTNERQWTMMIASTPRSCRPSG